MRYARIQRRPRSERAVRAWYDRTLSSFQSRNTEKAKEASKANFYFAQAETLRQGLERDCRFPRPCRFVARRFVLACEFAVCKPFSRNLSHSQSKTLPIIQILAIVVSKSLLVKVAKKVEWFHADISSRDATLQQRPEVLKAVRVNPTVHVLDGVVYDFVCVVSG